MVDPPYAPESELFPLRQRGGSARPSPPADHAVTVAVVVQSIAHHSLRSVAPARRSRSSSSTCPMHHSVIPVASAQVRISEIRRAGSFEERTSIF